MKIKPKIFPLAALVIILITICFFVYKNSQKAENGQIENENEEEGQIYEGSWKEYKNLELGFSVKIPEEILAIYKCPSAKEVMVPVEVFEDNEEGIVYITPAYYYEAGWSVGQQEFIGECEEIEYSLEMLKAAEIPPGYYTRKPLWGFVFFIEDINVESDLRELVKKAFGPDCEIGVREKFIKDGLEYYDVKKISSSDEIMGGPDCPTNYSYKIFYSPEKKKAAAIPIGQYCLFSTSYAPIPGYTSVKFKCYDEEMVNSFRFE